MDFFDVIRGRRSVRSFKARPVQGKDIETCLEAARLAPSATNAQPWRLLVARSPQKLAALAAAGHNQPCLQQAPVITVLLGDRSVYRKRLRRAKELADVGAVNPETMKSLESRYKDKPEASREENDMAIRCQCMLAGEHYVLAAAALGLGCCWVGAFDADQVCQALGLDPKQNFPVALLPTGVAAEETPPPRPRYSISDIAWNDEPNLPWTPGTV